MPLVATAPPDSAKVSSGESPNGAATWTGRSTPARPPTRRSPAQSSTKASKPSSSAASSSANTPLAMPPTSMRRPGGRRTVPARGSTVIWRQRSSGWGAAGARGGAAASAARRSAPSPSKWLVVAGELDLVGQRDVDQAAGVARRRQARLDDAPHQRADGDGGGRVAVEAAQLAALSEAREALVPGQQRPPGHRRRGGGIGGPGGVGHDHRALAAEAGEGVAVLGTARNDGARERA